MCGIFGYLNYNREKARKEIVQILLNGLKRLEYRGYDSAGIAFSGSAKDKPVEAYENEIFRCKGKVENLEKQVFQSNIDLDEIFEHQAGIGHTRWATHGIPSEINSHPQVVGSNDFTVVHNGILTNYIKLKAFLETKGYVFKSETDTECIPTLLRYLYNLNGGKCTFLNLVEQCVEQLEGSFAIVIKSRFYPNELIATRYKSPLIIGINSSHGIKTTDIPTVSQDAGVEYFLSSDAR